MIVIKISKVSCECYGSKKRLLIKLLLAYRKGALVKHGSFGGFRFAVEGTDSFPITSVSVISDSIYIYTSAAYNALSRPEECCLVYEPTDSEYIADDNGVMDAGQPVSLFPQGNYSPYFHCGEISEIAPLLKSWNSVCVDDIPPRDRFRPFVCNANVIQPRVLNHMRCYPSDSIVFIRFELECGEDMETELLLGGSGKLKCSVDGGTMTSFRASELLFASFVVPAKLCAGQHTIDLAFCNTLAGRGDKGVSLRLRRTDSDGELPMLVRSENAEYFFNV